ncbi:hypothetical protein OF83DRAFT_1032484, partial [Amylostereum chailletii]
MNAQRSNTHTRLRTVAGPTIFSCEATDLATSAARKRRFQDEMGMVEGTDGPVYNPMNAKIVHDPSRYTGKFDRNTVFLNPALIRLYGALICGPSAATVIAGGGTTNATPRGEQMKAKHHLTHTTPGAIAGTAVLVR